MRSYFMVRVRENVEEFVNNGIVAIGWSKVALTHPFLPKMYAFRHVLFRSAAGPKWRRILLFRTFIVFWFLLPWRIMLLSCTR